MDYAFHAGIAVVSALAAALAAWPLRRSSPRLLVAVVVLVPLLTLVLYQAVGTPAALDRSALQRGQETPITPESFTEAIAQLRAELERDPEQPEGWALLARSYAVQQDFPKARESFARALEFAPDDPMLLVEAAQARAQADPRMLFDDEALEMLQRAVRLHPDNQRGQWFIGIAQRQRDLHAEAAQTWEALLPRLDAATAASLRPQIDDARAAAGLPPLPADSPAAAAPSASAHAIDVRVSLDPALAARVPAGASVFVIARLPGGMPMPVAAEKRAATELPLQTTLDDGDSPMPTQALSTLDEVEVFARLSASGDAARREGDIESAPVRVKLPAKAPVELVIGRPAP